MQKATIINYFADEKTRADLLHQLADFTESKPEALLLQSAVSGIRRNGLIDNATQEMYEEMYPHEGPPFFPFLELCFLPQLFKPDDIVKYKGKYYQVQAVPFINEHCDFSDECYLCFPVDSQGHAHIHLCEAERPTEEERKAAIDILIQKIPR